MLLSKRSKIHKHRSFLLPGDKEPYSYFPIGNEDKYLKRNEAEVLEEIVRCKVGAGKIFLIKSDYRNGNTSYLNYLMYNTYSSNEPYSRAVFSIQGKEDDKLSLLKGIYKDVFKTRYKPSDILYLLAIYKWPKWKSLIFLALFAGCYSLGGVLIYLFTSTVYPILAAIGGLMIPALIAYIVKEIYARAPNAQEYNVDEDDNLLDKLRNNLSRKVKSDFGYYLFVDDIEYLEKYGGDSAGLLLKLLNNKSDDGMRACVILYKEDSSKVISDIKDRFGNGIYGFKALKLRAFTIQDKIKAAKIHGDNVSEDEADRYGIAEITRYVNEEEEDKIVKLHDYLYEEKPFSKLTLGHYIYFAPYEQRLVPVSHVTNFMIYIRGLLSSITGGFYDNMKIEVPRDIPWGEYDKGGVTLIAKYRKTCERNYKYFSLMEKLNVDYLGKDTLGNLGVINLLWSIYTLRKYEKLTMKGGVARRLLKLIKNSNLDVELEDYSNILWLREKVVEGLRRVAKVLLYDDYDFVNAEVASKELLTRQELVDVPLDKSYIPFEILLDIYNLTYSKGAIDTVVDVFGAEGRFNEVIGSRILFYRVLTGRDKGEITSDVNSIYSHKDVYSKIADIIMSLKYIELSEDPINSKLLTVPEVPLDKGNIEEFILSFLRADIYGLMNNRILYLEEINSMLIRLQLFEDNMVTKLEKGIYRSYISSKILYYVYMWYFADNGLSNQELFDKVVEDVGYIYRMGHISREDIYIKVIELLEETEGIAYYAGADSILIDICYCLAAVLKTEYDKDHKRRESYRVRIEKLLRKGLYIEKERRISLLSPRIYLLLSKCVPAEEMNKDVYAGLYNLVNDFNYPLVAKRRALVMYMRSIFPYSSTKSEYEKLRSLYNEFVALFESDWGGIGKELKMINYNIHYNIQSLRLLGSIYQDEGSLGISGEYFNKAEIELSNVENRLRKLPETPEVIRMYISKDIIKYDLLESKGTENASLEAGTIINGLYEEFKNSVKQLERIGNSAVTGKLPPIETRNRLLVSMLYYSNMDDIILRAAKTLDHTDMLSITRTYYICDNLDELESFLQGRVIRALLKAGYRLNEMIYEKYNDDNTVRNSLETLQEIGEYYKELDLEINILQFMLTNKLYQGDEYSNNKYSIRSQELSIIRRNMIINIDDEELRYKEIEGIVAAFLPEADVPENIWETLKNALSMYHRSKYKECTKVLIIYYNECIVNKGKGDYIYYDEIRMMKLLLRCYNKLSLEPESKEMDTVIYNLSREKEIIELERLIYNVTDPDIIDVLKILKSRIVGEK